MKTQSLHNSPAISYQLYAISSLLRIIQDTAGSI